MNSHQIDIVRLAWARRLAMPDDAFLSIDARVVCIDDESDTLDVVVLDRLSAVAGPEWAVERTEDLDNAHLTSRTGLRELAGPRAGRCSGPTILAYADDVRGDIGRRDPLISHDLSHVVALEASIPPDDVASAELARKRNWFTVLDDSNGEADAVPASGAAYLEWEGLLADMGVVTEPSRRRKGYGFTVARLATNDAIDAGLVPQWQADIDNTAARLLGEALGYVELGVHTSLRLTGGSTLDS